MQNEYLNSGTLFSTSVKLTPNSPEYYGDVTLDLDALNASRGGKIKLRMSGWKKLSTKGNTFLSIAFQPFDENRGSGAKKPVQNDDPF